MPDENKKIKILVFADSPAVATGFGKVTKGIFKNLAETGKYEITIFGINDRGGWKDPVEHPYKIYPTAGAGSQDIYGFTRLLSILRGRDWEIRPPWDIVFTLNDPFILEMPLMGYNQGLMHIMKDVLYKLYRDTTKPEFWWKLISYWPVDSSLKGNWVADAIALPDYSVAYTKYGVQEIDKANKSLIKPSEIKNLYIYHGTDVGDFFQVTPEEKKEFKMKFFKKNNINPDTFIVTCVARNQIRKDIPRTMKIFREFQKRRPDSFLYIHAKNEDAHGTLTEFARNFGLEQGRDWTIPSNFNENIGFPVSALNLIYNASDVVISTSHGEGWGLCLHPDSLIKTRLGYQKISEINVGQFALTRDGYKEILDKKERFYNGELMEIVVKGRSENDSLKLTPEHQVLTDKGWKKASDITINDYLYDVQDKFEMYTRQKFDLAEYCNELQYCRSEKYIWNYGSYKKNYKRFIFLNKDFAELYGIYLAEGSASSNGIVFSISQEEKEFTERIKNLVKKVWGLDVYIENDKNSKKRWVRIEGNILKRFYSAIAGVGARNKEIKIYKKLTRHTAAKILKGFWLGDGSTEKTGYEMTTSSSKLAYGLSALGDRLGIRFSLERNYKRDSYRLRTNSIYAYNFSMIIGNQAFEKYKFNKINNYQLKIKKINKIKYSGFVCDLGIDQNHEFMTNHCLVHNCITESMATKTINLAPNHTSITEIFGVEDSNYEDLGELEKSTTIRGIPMKNGSTTSEWVTYGRDDYERIRPITNVDDGVKKLIWIYDNPDKAKVIVERAYNWIQQYSWKNIIQQWDELFTKVYQELEEERKTYDPEKQKQKIQESLKIDGENKKE